MPKTKTYKFFHCKPFINSRFSKVNLIIFALIFLGIWSYFVFSSSAASNSGDINGDGFVNVFDLSLLLASYGHNQSKCVTNADYICDINADNVVNIFDLSILLTNYGAAAPVGYVHQSGTQLLDGNNNPLRLHGVNLGGYLSWEGWIWGNGFDYVGESKMMSNLAGLVGQTQADQFQTDVYNNFITSADFQALSSYGVNAVRLPINYRMLEDDSNPGVYKQAGWNVLDNLVNEAKQNNVYLILDMHVAPCSQNMGFTEDYIGGPDFLWTTPACQDRTVALWKAIAQRYASEKIIAGYDLLNESVTSDANLLSLYQRITTAIRQVDINHLLIYEGNNTATTFTVFAAPLDSNEMISVHDYSWNEPSGNLSGNFPTYDAAATLMNCPMWVGEFGQAVFSTVQQQVNLYKADPLIAGWSDWTYKQSPGFAAMQTIQESAAAKMLIEYMNNTNNPQPTLVQAQQGMSDFINEIQIANTTPNVQMQQLFNSP